jgi:hypothetical protein
MSADASSEERFNAMKPESSFRGIAEEYLAKLIGRAVWKLQ